MSNTPTALMARLAGVLCVLLATVAVAGGESSEELAEAMSGYIVHVAHEHAPRPSRPRLLARAYTSFLRDNLPEIIARPEPRLLYSYVHAATGFAARLTARQAAHLESQPSVLAVVPDPPYELHTTLTPSFLDLSESFGLLRESKGATDVVIGVIDTGVYPMGRASFAAAQSLPRPPSTFRGRCVSTRSFNASAYCNNKLVGAKFFYKGYEAQHGKIDEREESKSPLDTKGHGTRTASTAAGSAVENAHFYDYAKGKAVGMAPGARLAVYKVSWKKGGVGSDILMAFDEAIADGVDVISISMGPSSETPEFYKHLMAVGAFSAVRKGIVVSASAGNKGPRKLTVSNSAPWILTVGASTINRRFPATVVLGNGKTITGASLYAGPPLNASNIPLVYGGAVGSDVCEAGKLKPGKVAGKIVLCEPGVSAPAAKGLAVKLAGGAGAIMAGTQEYGEQARAIPHIFPAAGVTFADAKRIKAYIKTKRSPVATIKFLGTVVGSKPSSPRVASFSSRGPNLHAPEILKPDVVAPGVDILAAWTGKNSPTKLKSDTRRVRYNIISGTSMACPHVSGIAAMLPQARPDWSPAAIKSALMTTASDVDSGGLDIADMSTGQDANPFAYGAGHVSPNSALDPGLVYDAGDKDYIDFLCAIGYNANQIALFTRDGSVTDCSKRTSSSVGDHNYPAFSVVFKSHRGVVTQRRVVRNVGSNVRATYAPWVTSPPGVRVSVKPLRLRFSATRKTYEYEITFTARRTRNVTREHTFGSIVWSDGRHRVASPIAVTWPGSPVAEM